MDNWIAIWKKIKCDYYLMSYRPVDKFQTDQPFKHKRSDYTRNRERHKNFVYNLGFSGRTFKIKHKIQKA